MSTIIVASDAPSVRSEVVGVLDEPENDIIEVNVGQLVAPAVRDHDPDLVVVDLQMGNMGAMAVCMELRLELSYGNLPYVPVLMLLDRRADVFLARRSGAEGWIVKPLDPIRMRKAAAALMSGGTYNDPSFRPIPANIDTPGPEQAPISSEGPALDPSGTA